MAEQVEQRTGEAKEQLAGHMVDMRFGIPEGGIHLDVVSATGEALDNLQEEHGEYLGLVSVRTQVDIPTRALRVVAHVHGFKADAEQIVPYVAQVVEEFGIEMPQGLPEYTTHLVDDLKAS